MKKIVSLIAIISLLLQYISPVLAIETNSLSSPWTIAKAEHLARKALFGATPDMVNSLYNAGSASAAVNLLFSSNSGPDRTTYDNELNIFTSQTGFSITNSDSMKKYYAFKKYRDPYEAKAKAFVMFEDIFSVNAETWNAIQYSDIENTHKLIYDNMFDSSYKDLIKRLVFNGQLGGGDYSLGKFLDLFNGQNPNSPNENFARELMQLFLMLEYKPWENQDIEGAIRNYTDADIISLSKILTGLETDANTHQVSFNPNKHNTGSFIFLEGDLKSGDNFDSFYNSASGTINSNAITNSISGNNGLTDNIIDYIFSKRESEIANFIAWRILKYYVKDKPTKNEIENLTSVIISNNFNLFATIKYLLASDIMYFDESMNNIYYKNPLELTIGTLKLLHYKNPSVIDPFIYDSSLLTSFEWTPYFPGSIFGRDGFDNNFKFFNSYNHNQWVNFSTKLAYYSNKTDYYNIDDIMSIKSIAETGSLNIKTSTGNTFSGNLNLENISLTISGTLINSTDNGVLNNTSTGDIQSNSGQEINNTIIFSQASVALPNFFITTNDNSIINIDSGNIDMSNKKLIIYSGSVTYSGNTYEIISGTSDINILSILERDINISEMISQFENFLYLGRKLPQSVKTEIEKYLLTDDNGKARIFLPNNLDYKNKYIRGVISIMLVQTEFLMISGYDKNSQIDSSLDSLLPASNSKLIFIELYGGYDWLHALVQKDNYDDYVIKRQSLALEKNDMIDLGDYYMHPAYQAYKPLYDSNNLRIINRVGSTKHSRGHDTAAIQITSKNGLETSLTPSIIGDLIKDEVDATKNVVLGTNSPNIYSNGNYLNIGGGDSRYTNYASNLTFSGKISQLQTVRNILNSRTFPGDSSNLFKGSITIDNVANISKNAGGQPSSGNSLKQRLDFTKVLIDNNLGTTYYIPGGGGYDTHGNQVTEKTTDYDLTNRITDLSNEIASFFNNVKNKDVTIVIFSEFGRTLITNGTFGTDHGQGGGMFILSSNQSLLNAIPNKIVGNMNLAKEKSDWLGVGVDYRSIYNKILGNLYNISDTYLGSKYNLENDLSLETPKVKNLNVSSKNTNGTIHNTIEIDIVAKNFDIKNASNVVIKFGKTLDNLNNTINSWETQYGSNPIVKGNKIKFTKSISGTGFAYEVKILNSQFIEKILTGALIFDNTNTGAKIISPNKDTFIRNYSKNITSQTDLGVDKVLLGITSSGETLKTLTKGNGISLKLASGSTYIEKRTGSGIWNGGFILGSIVDKELTIGDEAITSSGEYVKDLNIEKIIKIGADTLGIGLKLDKSIQVELDNFKQDTKYKLIYSEDLKSWNYMTGVTSDSTGKILFETDHFTYFALVDDTPPIIVPPVPPIPPVISIPVVSSGGGGGGGGLSKDNCPDGDFSYSYYDKTCVGENDKKTLENDTTNSLVKNDVYSQNMKNKILVDKLKSKSQIQYTDTEVINKIKYSTFEIITISGYKFSDITKKLSITIINSKKISKKDKIDFINRLNEFLLARYNYEKSKGKDQILKNKYTKQVILLKGFIKKMKYENN